jgi:hypothetical protein
VEIRCPPDCRYLRHERYQGERYFEPGNPWFQRYAQAHEEGAERFALLLLLDTTIGAFFRRHPDLTLEQVLRGLEYLRLQAGPLAVPEGIVTDLEVRLKEGLDRFLEKSRMGFTVVQEAIEEARTFYESQVGDDATLRDYVRFASAFGAPESEPEPDGGEGGLIIPPR